MSSTRQLRAVPTWVLLIPLVLLVVGLAGLEARSSGSNLADSAQLVQGAAVADHCLARGQLTRCGRTARYYCAARKCARATGYTTVGPFPLLQYVPAWILRKLGLGSRSVLRGLVALNGIALLALLLALGAIGKRSDPRLTALLLIAVVASPLLWYSNAAFGEGLAAALLALFTLAILRAWHPLAVGLLTFASGITKETSFPFVIAIALIGWHASGRRPTRATAGAAAAGLLASIVASALFNLFRFGSPFNLFYDASTLHTPWSQRPQFFAALLVSPNGGILWYWPVAVALVVACCITAIRRRGWNRGLLAEPAVMVALMLLVLLAGLSTWFSPFGAAAWGPRLTIPWLLPCILLLVAAYGTHLRAQLRRHRTAAVAMVAGAALAALPQLGVTFDSARARHVGLFGAEGREISYSAWSPDATCPTPPVVQVDPAHYYRCVRHFAWARKPALLTATADVWRHELDAGLLLVLAVGGLGIIAARGDDAVAPVRTSQTMAG